MHVDKLDDLGVCVKSHGPNRDMRQDGMSLPF